MPEMPIQDYADQATPAPLDKVFMLNEAESILSWSLATNIPAIAQANAAAAAAQADADAAQAAAAAAEATANTKVAKTGDTMTGTLTARGLTLTEFGANLPADPTNPLEAATKQYVDAAATTAANTKVAKTGDTMTGNLAISNTAPIFEINDTDSAAGGRKWQMRVYSERLIVSKWSDDGITELVRGIEIRGDGLVSLRQAGVTRVEVPAPTVANSATTKDYVDSAISTGSLNKVAKAGDTMTGDLTITKAANPALTINGTGTGKPIIKFQDDAVTRWDIEYDSPGGYLEFTRRDSAGSSWGAPVVLHDDGTVNLVSATKVQVPTVTGSGQAAEVTGYNAATGELSICGRHIGDTGWRNIASLVSPAIPVVGNCYIRRQGSHVSILADMTNGPAAMAPHTNFFAVGIPAGFTAPGGLTVNHTVYLDPDGAIHRGYMQGGYVTTYQGLAANQRFELTMNYLTNDAWPATLPGVVVVFDEAELQSAAAAKPAKSKRKK